MPGPRPLKNPASSPVFDSMTATLIGDPFARVDAQGGINGHQIAVTADLDDGGSPSQFTQQVHVAIDQDHAFAVGVASAYFTPNYFVSTNTPTYGYNVSANWNGPPNLFAAGGSTQFYAPGIPYLGYVTKRLGANSIAFISYGQSIASSYDACTSEAGLLKKAGYNVNLVDVSAQLAGTYASDVQRMQQAGSQIVFSCMQGSDNVTMSRDIQQYGVKIKQFWFNGYDKKLFDQDHSLMQGVYLTLTGSVPFEAGSSPRFGNTYPGMQQYLAAMNKYDPGYTYNGVAFQGWQSAVLLADGIRAAGNNVTQANVIAQTNKITNFTAGGVTTVTDWTVDHTGFTEPNCNATVQVQGNNFVTVLSPGKQVFVCFGPNPKHPVPVPAPAGTPGP